MKKDMFNVCLMFLFVITIAFIDNPTLALADADCSGIIGSSENPDDTAYYLQIIINVMKYGSIALFLVLTIKDLFMAIVNPDKDGLKKTWNALFKRIICVILIFLLPVVINILLALFSDGDNPFSTTCGLK